MEVFLCVEFVGFEGFVGFVVCIVDEFIGFYFGVVFVEVMELIGVSYDGLVGLVGSYVGVDVFVIRFDVVVEFFVELLNIMSLVEEDIVC